MSDNYHAVPPRKTSGAEVVLPVVLTLNGMSRNLSLDAVAPISVDTDADARKITLSFDDDGYVRTSGAVFSGNVSFGISPAPGLYGLALHSQSSDPSGAPPGAMYFNSILEVVRYYTGTQWRTLDVGGGAGVMSVQAGAGLLADGVAFGVITSTGALSINYAADGTWSGTHGFSGVVTFSSPVTFAGSQTFNAAQLTIASQSTGDLLYRSPGAWARLPIGTAGQVLTVSGGVPTWQDAAGTSDSPVWTKYTVAYTDLNSTPGTSSSTAFATLPAAGIIHAVKVKHSQAFAGGANTSATMSVGISGDDSRFSKPFDVFQSVGNTAMQHSLQLSGENHGAPTTVYATLSVGSDVATLSQGSCDIWLLVSLAN